jgi:hypothetical protein
VVRLPKSPCLKWKSRPLGVLIEFELCPPYEAINAPTDYNIAQTVSCCITITTEEADPPLAADTIRGEKKKELKFEALKL